MPKAMEMMSVAKGLVMGHECLSPSLNGEKLLDLIVICNVVHMASTLHETVCC